MTKDCSLIYQFSTWKLQAHNMLCTQIVFCFDIQNNFHMYTTCSELVVFMYWTCKSINNLLSYCGLVHMRINASDKDLRVPLKFKFWYIFIIVTFQLVSTEKANQHREYIALYCTSITMSVTTFHHPISIFKLQVIAGVMLIIEFNLNEWRDKDR